MENHQENLLMEILVSGPKMLEITIKKIVKKNNFILVGSSMGAWLSINQFKHL